MDRLAETIAILAELVAFPTVSADSNLEMAAWMAARLSDHDARIDWITDPGGTKATLFASFGPDPDGPDAGPDTDGGVMLSGHTDVVPVADQDWTSDPFTLREAHGRLYGRGTCDMKGFIAAVFAMLPDLAQARRPLHIALTHDEEVGCLGARQLVDALADRGLAPRIAIIGEPTGMRIVEGHKGCNEYTTLFEGRDGHGSSPDRGVNAVEYAVRFVGKLMELRAALQARAPTNNRFDPPWTTINVGALTGGTAHNVIAARAELAWEMRPVQPGDADFVKDALARYCEEELLPAMRAIAPEARIETDIVGEIVALEPHDDNAALALVAALTGRTEAEVVAFGTEAGLFRKLGTHAVVCGPGEIAQAHKPDEFVSAEQLSLCLDMLGRLAARLVADPT